MTCFGGVKLPYQELCGGIKISDLFTEISDLKMPQLTVEAGSKVILKEMEPTST